MAKKKHAVQIGKHKFELSNLEKVLWPENAIVKAELIQYYLQIAPTFLAHAKHRPLSLIRFPDGIHGETFFQKNKPDWAPEWIDDIVIGNEQKSIRYMLANNDASLVWIANLASIEFHQMQYRTMKPDLPDYFVFDLDPPDGYPFPDVVELALALREHLESYGYHSFAKTTGRKGIHIVCPIDPKWDYDQVFEATKAMARPFVQAHPKNTTLKIQKNHRTDKVLIDIYRNRPSQTIVCAYSLRALEGAAVSMPLPWDELATLRDHRDWNIHTALERVKEKGDAWEGMEAYRTGLHTQQTKKKPKKNVAKSRSYKTPEQLDSYEKKRRFDKTAEPKPAKGDDDNDSFVVHRHHASRLHYDLRLEKNGTLESWAVPKGMPPEPGMKRLAVKVEDHPIEYLHFQGEIPKGEYGGGMMWIYASGKYEITKQKKDGFYFQLRSPELTGEYRMYATKENQWLLERVDSPQIDWLGTAVEPMLCTLVKEPPDSSDWMYEVKWDGIRALIAVDDGEVTIHSRNQNDITDQFPELLNAQQSLRATSGLFDAEIVCLDDVGRPVFKNVIRRLQQRTEKGIARVRSKYAAIAYVFDCLYLDGRAIVHEPLERRREWLKDVIIPSQDAPYRLSEAVEDGHALFEAAREMGLEGIVAKLRKSSYQPGRRSDSWLKIKSRSLIDCVIIGYTEGAGDRADTFGALHIAEPDDDGGYRYLGKVGTGFDGKMLAAVRKDLDELDTTERPVKEKPIDDKITVWVKPALSCEVRYASITDNGTLREPVFVRMRTDSE